MDGQWRPLDLRRRGEYGPEDGELIALHLLPRCGREERYLIGSFFMEEGRAWFSSAGNTLSPGLLRKHYTFRWLPLPEDA